MAVKSGQITRRSILGAAAALALGVAGTAQAQGIPIREIRVSGRANRDLARLAPMVARELARRLGPRYAPGARGGATLVVTLTGVELPDSDSGSDFGFMRHFGGNLDVLDGQIALIGPGGAQIRQFPLLAQTTSTDASDRYPDATDLRLASLASTYCYWIVSKLG
jgi:hypothetical protein